MNLSVINSPDSAGLACDFQPWSFYLGGKRTYWGLPNNPDYDLPALAGSPCDTLVSQNELAGAAAVGSLHVYYHSDWDKAFINASNLKGKTGKLMVYDMQGKVVHSEPLRIQNGYYTKDLSMTGYTNGMYLVTIETEMERPTKKLMID
ncbi:MAG: T9SS type A sorting domain-containing protein [Bacteroidetes bacterium]|nr:T9SS type A sorting domain-containing protein [Bacteroidota bacterium]